MKTSARITSQRHVRTKTVAMALVKTFIVLKEPCYSNSVHRSHSILPEDPILRQFQTTCFDVVIGITTGRVRT